MTLNQGRDSGELNSSYQARHKKGKPAQLQNPFSDVKVKVAERGSVTNRGEYSGCETRAGFR